MNPENEVTLRKIFEWDRLPEESNLVYYRFQFHNFVFKKKEHSKLITNYNNLINYAMYIL